MVGWDGSAVMWGGWMESSLVGESADDDNNLLLAAN